MASTEHRTRTFAAAARQLQHRDRLGRCAGSSASAPRRARRHGDPPRDVPQRLPAARRDAPARPAAAAREPLLADGARRRRRLRGVVHGPRAARHDIAIAASGDVPSSATSHAPATCTRGRRRAAGDGVLRRRPRRRQPRHDARRADRSGDVHVSALRPPRRLRVDAGSGDVDVAVPTPSTACGRHRLGRPERDGAPGPGRGARDPGRDVVRATCDVATSTATS